MVPTDRRCSRGHIWLAPDLMSRDQAFAAGVVQQLIGLQNNVGWTAAAVAEETDYRRMAIVGYAAAIALVIAVVTFGYTTWR